MALNEFKPPSDFVAEDGGGSGKSWLKWLGIGCGVIVLIIGGLLAVGTWKTASCCGDLYDQARLSVEAGKFSTEFGNDLAQGEVEAARAKMTDALRAEVSADDLQSTLSQYERFLVAGPGRLSNVSVEKKDMDQPTRWKMTLDFAPPAGTEKLVAMLEIISRGEDEAQTFLVDELKFETRTRDISSEPPAVEVLDFHRQLRGGNFENAYRHMSSGFTQQNNVDAFRSFVREQKEVFRTGDVDIQSIDYSGQKKARVVALLTNDSGESARVVYDLVRPVDTVPKWLIEGVTPNYDAAAPAPDGAPDKDEQAGEDGAEQGDAGAGEADAGGGDAQN
ncbi:hypothetical protein FIV42_03045 [Persicimonas caeni]|uniref:Uncharacterized protein n=1 Tax=Persicimonas caeni TaxID=2292766 RepID=A0A4Y6PP17_PERCE|nr:hypothetical protein [Persicimonas caeni]QDG49747.1 hypothetical protein FIV42_03045 [Persicimonas caeni]QED30968.1 hypothetical protein FRD00_03040 [Persicimonas caeni]